MTERSRVRTWQLEIAAVAAVLLTVLLIVGGGWREAVGSAAVLATFAHAQVASRMAEAESARPEPDVHCWRWSLRYFVTKETCWFVYFAAARCWSALVGVVVFLAYPLWRSHWCARRRVAKGGAA